MKIKLFEIFDIDLDVTYELYIIDKNGDEEELDENINLNDLRDVF